jgi:hypothetical protein
MKLRPLLVQLAEIVADEAERNSPFRRHLEEALSHRQMDLPAMREERVRETKPRDDKALADPARKGGRRTPAVLDPLGLARQGEDVLRKELSALDIEQLRDVVAQYGMDPGKLVMKWKDTVRIIDRIVELSLARSTKGDAFRADKPSSSETPGD